MEAWSWSFTLYPCAFPSLWRFAFDCKVGRIITAAVKTPSQAPQLRITILLSVHSSSHPAEAGHQQHSSHYQSTPCLCGIPALSLTLLSNTHIHSTFFFSPSLKSIESLRKYWQLEATTGWSDSRKPLIMITSSYFSFSFPRFSSLLRLIYFPLDLVMIY